MTRPSFVVVLFIILFFVTPVRYVEAAQFSVLYSFSLADTTVGVAPIDGPTLVGSTLYGPATATTVNSGALYKFDINDNVIQSLKAFPKTTVSAPSVDGSNPTGRVAISGNKIYGAASNGGIYPGWMSPQPIFGGGVVYSVNTDGSDYQVLKSFNYPQNASAELTTPINVAVNGSTLFGTTGRQGSRVVNGNTVTTYGSLFSMNLDGTNLQELHSFQNMDGAGVSGELLFVGSTIYGTTQAGGTSNFGTLYKVNTDGSGFQVLHTFTGGSGDGAVPVAGNLALSGDSLIGLTTQGGAGNQGTVYKIDLDGSGFQLLHAFNGTDGSSPRGGLALDGSTIYGAAVGGGAFNLGEVFSINTDGTGFDVLHSFDGVNGANPVGIVKDGDNIYGATARGPSGTLFVLTVPEPSTYALMATALLGLAWTASPIGKRRRRQ